MGWSVGTNDAANAFGTAVGTRVLKYRTAIWLTAVFAVLGAAINGDAVFERIGDLARGHAINTALAAFIVMLVAASVVTFMSYIKAPVSTSQCIVGAMIGWGLSQGMANWTAVGGFFSAWIISPILTMFICLALCWVAQRYIETRVKGLAAYDSFIKWGYIIAGIFGAYSMGANNAANATGVYLHVAGIFDIPTRLLNFLWPFGEISHYFTAALIGGLAIALGTLTFSKRVMLAVGEGIVKLSPLQGFLVVFASSLTVYGFSLIGYSISTSQAVVGAVMGAGFSKGHRDLDFKVLGRIFVAWFGTPTIAGLVTFLIGIAFFR